MLEYCTPLRWRPEIGDPTVVGWVTVVVYIVAAGMSVAMFSRSKQLFAYHYYPGIVIRKQQLFWLIFTIVLAFLAVNKQLDLQSLFTEIGRCVAKEQGWYNTRRGVQTAFILGMGVMGIAAILLLFLYFRQILKDNWLAIVGFCLLVTFVFMRAASFHHFDEFIHSRIFGMKMNWILELFGLVCICAAALILQYRYRPSRPDIAKRVSE